MKKHLFLSDKTLFRDESVFEPGYVPETILYRDAELHLLSSCIAPAFRNGRPVNVLIQGTPATGKTTAIKHVFEELCEFSSKVALVHINCQVSSSPYKILSQIHKTVFGYAPPDTGVPKTRIYEKIYNQLAKDKKVLIVALDDMNYLFLSHDAEDVLASILRAAEMFPGVRTCVWGTTHTEIMHQLDAKNRSVFQPERIQFRNYTAEQIYQILKMRAAIGLSDGVIADSLVRSIAREAPDVRQALETLRQSVLKAERDGSLRVEQRHLAPKLVLPVLDEREALIFQVVQSGVREAGDIYNQCDKKQPLSYSTFYRSLQKLKAMQLIDIQQVGKKQGRTSIVTPKLSVF